MNLFKGLEKFGLKTEGTENLFEEEKRTNASTEQGEAKEEIPSEESFLLEKSVRCTVCDKVFKTKMIKIRFETFHSSVFDHFCFEHFIAHSAAH